MPAMASNFNQVERSCFLLVNHWTIERTPHRGQKQPTIARGFYSCIKVNVMM